MRKAILRHALGMKSGTLNDPKEEHWYTVDLKAGTRYFVDIRNVGETNCYIEVYYNVNNQNQYFYTTNPEENDIYDLKPEKYLYMTAPVTGKYYIKIASSDNWEHSSSFTKNYFFYVGPENQTYTISGYPIGGVSIFGSDKKSLSLDLFGVVPESATIVNLSISDTFPLGSPCTDIEKSMRYFGGKTYSNIGGSSEIYGMSGVNLRQSWNVYVKCGQGSHVTQWVGRLNCKFKCKMAPHPGNELDL